MQNNPGGHHKQEFDEEDLDDLMVLSIGIPASRLRRLEEIAEDQGASLDWVINDMVELHIVVKDYMEEFGTDSG